MYSRNNYSPSIVIIKPKYHIVKYIKNNSFFNKIIGYNNIKTMATNK